MKHLYGSSADLDRIEDVLHSLRRTSLTDQEMQVVRGQIERLERYQASDQAALILRDISLILQRLRNSIAHGMSSEPRPAYSLDDGDDNA